jgi:hypothetical protein
MKNWKRIAGLFFPILIAVGVFSVWLWAQQCVERILQFQESFNATTYRDTANSSVDHWGDGYIVLNKLGSDFSVANPGSLPAWINTITVGDFDGDGWADFIGTSSSYSNALVFVRNLGVIGQVGSFGIMDDPNHYGLIDGTVCPFYPAHLDTDVPTRGVKGAAIDNDSVDGSEHCALTSGDYDGDGDLDFFYVVSYENSPYNIKRIWFYENQIIQTGTISFNQINKTSDSSFVNAIKGIAWSTTVINTLDFDKDGDPDILMGTKAGEVIKINNRNKTRAISASNKWNFATILTGAQTGWSSSLNRGVSTVSVDDLDNDNDLDIILGSVSYPDLQYWKNDGSGNFGAAPYRTYHDVSGNTHNNDYDGAATVSIAYDFDRDGDVDLMVGTDDWNYDTDGVQDAYLGSGLGGQCYYFRNSGGEFTQRLIYDGQVASPVVYDFDLGANFDYDNDGDQDFLIADGNHTENYYLFINNIADVYNLQGIAQSTNITPALDPNLYAITRLRILNLRQSVVGGSSAGLAVTVYVSNNDGMDWELYQRFSDDAIRDYASLNWHTFNHYGSKLKWKAELTATDDNIPEFPGASYETPRMDNIEFEIVYVERREYSRTSVAASFVDASGQQIKLIIGGTFYYPGWQGHIIAYDVTNMTAVNSSFSELRTVSRSDLTSPTGRSIVASGVTIRWDAGSLLDVRSPDSRMIYTALPNMSGTGMVRTDFTVANVGALAGYLQDVQGDDAGLINFVRGAGRLWKLGDINHSNPIVVGPPSGAGPQMGAGYEAFKSSWSNRQKVLFVGANDGMLHCFDVLTGAELWAYIPHNLLPKLKNMWAVDQVTLGRYFNRDVYVDGSPAVGDVYINGEWKTVLVCGQGPGKGSVVGGGINYYFALDVTNPANPIPLWELTDVNTMGETWSVPDIAKVTKDGAAKWVAFMGSGYDNNPNLGAILGNVFYAVELETGQIFWSFTANEVDTSGNASFNFVNIQNTMPGSPASVDADMDGFADSVYIGDLDGRMWKVDLTPAFVDASSWNAVVMYTDPDNYPIITKPAVWKNPNVQTAEPRVYFGTGGDDAAPNLATYSFVALIDRQPAEVEWFLGVPDAGGVRDASKDVGDIGVGEKIWADAKIADYTVYLSTLTGSIEAVDPCANLSGLGKLYARFIVTYAGTPVGGTAFKTATGPVESLALAIKTRSAVTLGEQVTTSGGIRKREVYIQEYDSTIQKLEQLTGGLVKVRSWREIYKIFKR